MSDRPSTNARGTDGGAVRPLVIATPASDGSVSVPASVKAGNGQLVRVHAVYEAMPDGTTRPWEPGWGGGGDGAGEVAGEITLGDSIGSAPGVAPTGNQRPNIEAACAEVLSRYGGGRVVLHRNYRIDGELITPPNVEVCYRVPPLARRTLGDVSGIANVPALYFTSTGYIRPQHSLSNLYCLPDGFSTINAGSNDPGVQWNIAALEAALDLQAAMEGRGAPIRVLGGNNPRPEGLEFTDITAMGMRSVVEMTGAPSARLRGIQGDCNNGIIVNSAGGAPIIYNLEISGILTPPTAKPVACSILSAANTGGKLTFVCGKPRLPPYKEWVGDRYIGASTKIWYGDKYYRALDSGILNNVPPTHVSPPRAVYGEVTLTYQGPWIGGAIGPATVIPKSTGGFLKAGHYLFCAVPPRETYTGNTSYPHYSTAGAPSDIATNGGDIGDPTMRGCYRVDSFGTITEDYWTVVLDVPYDAALAAAHVGREIQVMPLARLGAIFRSDEETDGSQIFGLNGKGPRFDALVEGSSHQIYAGTTEQPAQGELAIEDFGSTSLWAGRGASRLRVEGWIFKSKGTLVHLATRGNSVATIKGMLRGARFRAINHVSGYADIDVTFEGNSTVYSHSSARHMRLRWKGTPPVITGNDENAIRRVSTDGERPWPSNAQRALEFMGGTGFILGTGVTFPDWAPSTEYNNGAIVKNQILTTENGDYYLFRATHSGTQTSDSSGDGPQHTTGSATDGTCVWAALGIYGGGASLLYTDQSTTEVVVAAKATDGSTAEVFRARSTGPLLTGRIDHKRANGQTGAIVTDDGYLRPRGRTSSQFNSESDADAGTGLSRLAIVSNATGGEALAHTTDGGSPIVYATQTYVASLIPTFGTIATQNANAVAITGGTASGMTSVIADTHANTTGAQQTINYAGGLDSFAKSRAYFSTKIQGTLGGSDSVGGWLGEVAPYKFRTVDAVTSEDHIVSGFLITNSAQGDGPSAGAVVNEHTAFQVKQAVTGQYGSHDPEVTDSFAVVGAQITQYATSGQGGPGSWDGVSNPSTAYRGGYQGLNVLVRNDDGTDNMTRLTVAEFTAGLQGGNVFDLVGLHIGRKDDGIAADYSEAALDISSQSGTVPWMTGIRFGRESGNNSWPFDEDSAIIKAVLQVLPTAKTRADQVAGYGIDFRSATFADAAFASNGFSVADDGTVTAKALIVSQGTKYAPIVLTSTTALTAAAHHDRIIILASGGGFTLDAAAAGDGFGCVIVNRTGSDYTVPSVSPATVRYDGSAAHTVIEDGRTAAIAIYSISGTRYVDIIGGTA